MMVSIKKRIRRFLKHRGYRLERIPAFEVTPAMTTRTRLMERLQVDLLFSVGANRGQFDLEVRRLGYKGRIISFEPVKDAYEVLAKHASGDPHWTAIQCALGSRESVMSIHVASNSYSSSLLDMLPSHLDSAPHSKYISEEEVKVETFDRIVHSHAAPEDRIMLKIDTQGYERHVLEGALESIHRVQLVQMEMSLLPLYDGETLMPDMCRWMEELGFVLFFLENEFLQPKTGRVLQVNGIFVRKDLVDTL